MIFDVNQTEFESEYQRSVWQCGTHLVPLEISLADVGDKETREGCRQIYRLTMEILEDMYQNPDDYHESPRCYICDYLFWIIGGHPPMKKHEAEFLRYLKKIPKFGFQYDGDVSAWFNTKYPLVFDCFPRLCELDKKRKKNMGGYTQRRDFRLFAKRINVSFDDLLRPLSLAERGYCLDLHHYACSKGMSAEIKNPYTIRYLYKKLYALELHNMPFGIDVIFRLDNGKHMPDQWERFLEIVEQQNDNDALVKYILGHIRVCDACSGTKKANQRCGKWIAIRETRRLASMCHPAIGTYRGRKNDAHGNDEEGIRMLKRMIDVRVIQTDEFFAQQPGKPA